MNKKFSMRFSKKLLGEKSVYIHVLHHLSKFVVHCFTNKKERKKILAAGWIFFWKKSEKLKYLKNWMTHRKKISEFGRGTNEENNAKIAAINFEICGRR